ncbi:MAG: hypothetical protein E7099_01195 [Mediterranea massiliensis]|nr:hypothetical protein [Mediterranea massiliensis]
MKRNILISLGLAIGYGATQAQTIVPDTLQSSVIITDEPKSDDNKVIKAMYEANGKHFQDPQAPRFLFIDRKGKVALGIGGYVKGTLSLDMSGISDNPDFVTADIPVPSQAAKRSQIQMDASTSRIFLKLVGNNTKVGYFTVYLESDFRGADDGNYDLRLRQAYIQLGGFKAGRAWSTFTDPIACPPTIDFEGPSGTVSAMNVMLQYHHRFNKHWSMATAIEAPTTAYTTISGASERINERMPDLPSYLQYEWNKGKSHIRWSNLLRFLSYRNLDEGKNKTVIGWATALSGMMAFQPGITVYYQASYGRGYADYLNDLSGQGYDLIPDGSHGQLKAPYALGLVGGLQYNVTKNFFVSASYSQCRLYNQSTLSKTAYKYGQYVAMNAFYTPFNNCQIGIEYLYGNRTNCNRESGNAHRINAMIQYNF